MRAYGQIHFDVGVGKCYQHTLHDTHFRIYVNSFLSHLGQVIEHIDETGTLSELRNQEGYDMAGISGEARIRFKDGHALFLNSSEWHRVFGTGTE